MLKIIMIVLFALVVTLNALFFSVLASDGFAHQVQPMGGPGIPSSADVFGMLLLYLDGGMAVVFGVYALWRALKK